MTPSAATALFCPLPSPDHLVQSLFTCLFPPLLENEPLKGHDQVLLFCVPQQTTQLRQGASWSDGLTVVQGAGQEVGEGNTAVPTYLQGVCSETASGCLKPWIVPNPMYTMFFLYIHKHTYDKV